MSQTKFEDYQTGEVKEVPESAEINEEESNQEIAIKKEPSSSDKKPPRPKDNSERTSKLISNINNHPLKNVRKTSHSPYQIGRATVTNFKPSDGNNNLSSRNGNDSDKSIKAGLHQTKIGHGIDMTKLQQLKQY